MDNLIRCYCLKLGKRMIIAVQLADGSVEKRFQGQVFRSEGGGTVHLSCARCGFKEELMLDSPMVTSVAL